MAVFNSTTKDSSSTKTIKWQGVSKISPVAKKEPDSHSLTNTFNKRRGVNRTFRIRAEWDVFLREEAARRGISVNILMNMILRRCASFEKLARGFNVITMTKRAFREIIAKDSPENLAQVGQKTGVNDIQNILDMIGLPSNYESFSYLVTRHFGGPDEAMWFRGYYHLRNNFDVFHMQHNLGRGWSVYLKNYFTSYLKFLKIDHTSRVYDYAVNIKVPRLSPPQ